MNAPVVADDIDFVYTWVDGEKSAALRAEYAQSKTGAEQNRFRDHREIIQSIASVRRFAPFVRRIYLIAAEGEVPSWYNAYEYPDVKLVFHPELFGGDFSEFLPTFNSHSIEAMLPFISGLSERFVYFNDDMFLGAPVTPDDFFKEGGTAIIRFSDTVNISWQTHKKNWRVYHGNLYEHLQNRFPGAVVYTTAHQGRSLLKSSCLGTWHDSFFRALLIDTSKNRFRDRSDIPPIELFSNMMMMKNKACAVLQPGVVIQIFDRTVLGPEFCALKYLQPKFYCINDDMTAPSSRHLERFRHHLTRDLPHHLPASVKNRPSSIRSPRPVLGAAIRFIAHCISWVNRMLGAI